VSPAPATTPIAASAFPTAVIYLLAAFAAAMVVAAVAVGARRGRRV
jgi:hypothetical protein